MSRRLSGALSKYVRESIGKQQGGRDQRKLTQHRSVTPPISLPSQCALIPAPSICHVPHMWSVDHPTHQAIKYAAK